MDAILSDLFGLFCHQWPERSPQLAGAVFPTCYRCAGLYLGIFASYLYLAGSGGWRRRLPELKVVIGSSSLLVPFLIDGWGSTLGLWSAPGPLRSLTGLAAGVVLPLLLLPLARPLEDTAAATLTLPRLSALIWPLALGLFFVTMVVEPVALAAFEAAAFAASAGLLLFLGNVALAARTALGSGAARRGNAGSRPESIRHAGVEVRKP